MQKNGDLKPWFQLCKQIFYSVPSIAHSVLSSRIYWHSFSFYLRLCALSGRWCTSSLQCFFPARVNFFPYFGIRLAIWITVYLKLCFPNNYVSILLSYLLWNIVTLPPPRVFCSFHNFKLKNEMCKNTTLNIQNKLCASPQRIAEMICDIFGMHSENTLEKGISTYLGLLWNMVKHAIVTFEIDPRDDFSSRSLKSMNSM